MTISADTLNKSFDTSAIDTLDFNKIRRDLFPVLNKWDKAAFWARGYYVETIGNITDEAVQKYIKEQAEESRKEDSRSTAL